MADIIPSTVSLKCPSAETIALYNDRPQSGIIEAAWQPTESILLYNAPPQSGPIDEVISTEFVTYTN